jgi:REP-associated tyrosine transposase
MDDFPHQSNLRKGRSFVKGMGYFITKCTLHPKLIFINKPEIALILIECFKWIESNNFFKIDGFVIMPDHYHLIIANTGSKSLSELMRSLDQFSAKRINTILRRSGKFWEDGFYDHTIRNRLDYETKIKYIHDNPVKKGLCDSSEDYLFSSANNQYNNLVNWEWFL